MADTNVLSIQGEQTGGEDDQEIYLSFAGPGAKVALSKLAERRSTQRFVLEARAVSDSFAERADGEERHTRKFQVVEVVEFGVITEPEDDTDPSLFDDVAEG